MDCITNLGEHCLKNLLFLPHLFAMKTCKKEQLVDYNQSHVTSNKYLQNLPNKTMDKEAT